MAELILSPDTQKDTKGTTPGIAFDKPIPNLSFGTSEKSPTPTIAQTQGKQSVTPVSSYKGVPILPGTQEYIVQQIKQIDAKQSSPDVNDTSKKSFESLNALSGAQDGTITGSDARNAMSGVDTSTNSKAQNELDALKTMYESASSQPQTNLLNFYNTKATEAGLPQLDTNIVNLENIINGTEQDIRNELSGGLGGGVVTESQVQALVATRNKVLTNQLNSLLNLRQQKADWVNNQVTLYGQDAKTASDQFDKKIGYQEKIATLQNTIDNSGFKNTLSYNNYLQKEQNSALKMMDSLNKNGALGNLDPDTLQWLSDSTGIPADLITKAGTNAAAAAELKLKTAQKKISTNSGFGSVSNMAQAVISGLLAPSQLPGFGQNSLRTQVMNQVYAVNPSFDARQADSSYNFQKGQKSNLIQASINSANYAAKQIVDLSDKVDRGDIQPINAAQLLFKSKSGDVNTARFLSAVKIVGDEYGAVFGQGAATDFKAQLGLQVVDPSFSQAQFRGVLMDTVLPLMQARLQAIQEQGSSSQINSDLSDTSQNNYVVPNTQDQSYLNSLGF